MNNGLVNYNTLGRNDIKVIREVEKNIYAINVPLKGNPLKMLYSYFIRGDEYDLLIDTGFRRDSCREALEEALEALESDKSRRRVLCTHLHSDHSGMADLFAGENQPIFMSEKDIWMHEQFAIGKARRESQERFLKEGFPSDVLALVYATNPASTEAMPAGDPRMHPLRDGEVIRVGDYELQTVWVPGHTPGNCMFWESSRQLMFTGDHVLFDITPNITDWPGFEDSLGLYLDSLRKSKEFPVRLALPGHRETSDYHERIDTLLVHHAKRLAEQERIIAQEPGHTAYELAGQMQWKIRARNWQEFPAIQKWFAVGECMAHLDYLLKRGHITKYEEGGFVRYKKA